MSDIGKYLDLLLDLDIEFSTYWFTDGLDKTKIAVTLTEGDRNVEGYTRFYTDFNFNLKDGSFVGVGIYE